MRKLLRAFVARMRCSAILKSRDEMITFSIAPPLLLMVEHHLSLLETATLPRAKDFAEGLISGTRQILSLPRAALGEA